MIANSMGAFLAIAATTYLPITRCFAFGPQFSVDPSVVPDKGRWVKYHTDRRLPVAQPGGPFQRHLPFSGATPRERYHGQNLPEVDNIFSFILPGSDHDIAADLKASGRLAPLLQVCMERDRSRSAMCRPSGFMFPA